jgi:hypothetical protein
MLLQSIRARLTFATGVDKTPYTGGVTRLEFPDVAADSDHLPNDFVPWDHRIQGHPKVVADEVDVCMANATMGNFDYHIVTTGLSSFETERSQLRTGVLSSKRFCSDHWQTLLMTFRLTCTRLENCVLDVPPLTA